MPISIERVRINDAQKFAKLKTDWEHLQEGLEMTVYQTYDWNWLLYQEWKKSFLNKISSEVNVYVVQDNSIVVAILPIIVQRYKTKTKWFGRDKGLYLLGHGSYSDYLNLVYCDISDMIMDKIIEKICNDYPNLHLIISDVREDVFLCFYLKRKGIIPIKESVAVSVKMLETVSQYDACISKNTRQNLRTASNRMRKENINYELSVLGEIHETELLYELRRIHINRMKIKNMKDMDLLHKISSYIRISTRIYKEINNNIIYSSMQMMSNSCLVIVKLNSKIIGYLYGLRDRKTIRIMQNCFIDEYKFYSPLFRGAYDFILQCYENKEIEEVDFTRGNEDYKYKLAGTEIKLYEYII